MFTWISKATIAALILLLAACQLETGVLGQPGQTRAISVLGGAVTVAAPSAYCVDKASVRQQNDGAVVLIGRCNGKSASPPAVMSVTMGGAGSAGVIADGGAAMSAFFSTPAGHAALSRSGDASSVQILKAARLDGAYALYIAEEGVGDYWRAVFGLSGRLITVSVQGPEGAALDAATGQGLLGAAILAMRRANPSA